MEAHVTYIGFHNIVLIEIADNNYEFVSFNISTNMTILLYGVTNITTFYKVVLEAKLKLSPTNDRNQFPYIFVIAIFL
jgi:hypothetical protein